MGTVLHLIRKGGRAIFVRPRRAALALVLGFGVGVGFLPGAAQAASAAAQAASAAAPHLGGSITTSGLDLDVLDPAAAGATVANNGLEAQILGALFQAPANANGAPVPDLATRYQYNKKGTSITITLRRGVRFSDGTVFNSKAVIWNLRRAATSPSYGAPLLTGVSSMTSTSPNSVTISFSTPNFSFVAACITSAICDMGSPSAYGRLGAAGFGAAPVGAGPFQVLSSSASRVVLVRNPSYWDAAHVYLARWTVVDIGADPTVSYQALIQDTIQGAAFEGIGTDPSVLFVAKKNHNVTSRATAQLDYGYLPLNAYKAPFSDQRAREAIDFCTNREALARTVSSGYASPAYVLAGSSSAYLPRPGGIRGAETLMPYKFNVVQATALVAQLGGLTFQLDTTFGVDQVVANALSAQWAACGIHATVVPASTNQVDTALETGTYQAAYVTTTGAVNPVSSMVRESPASPLSVPGLADAHLSSLVQMTVSTNSPARLASLWHQIWFEENTDAIDIPIISSGVTVLVSHCLRGFGYVDGLSLVHASLACHP
jgi:peptide/nickel transport system substrate-binding protein